MATLDQDIAHSTDTGTEGATRNVVTVTPPPAGARVVIQVEPGQTILLQGINIATAKVQQLDGGLQITLAGGAVIFLAGFVAAAEDANPPVIEIAGLARQDLLGNEDFSGAPGGSETGTLTISAADLLAAASGQPLVAQPAAGPVGDGSGARFAANNAQEIGEGLARGGLLGNEDFQGAPPAPVFGESQATEGGAGDANEDDSAPSSGGGSSVDVTPPPPPPVFGPPPEEEDGIENDTPDVEISADTGATVTHDESAGIQNGGAGELDGDDVSGAALPAAILAAFSGIANRGSDADVSAKDNGAIGFARSAGALVTLDLQDFGADGAAAVDAIVYAFVDPAGADAGVDTSEGDDVFLFLENGMIVGRIDDASGEAAFALAMDPATGEVFVAQYLSLAQLTPGDGSADSYDEAVALANGAVQVAVTITDGNGDSDTSAASVGGQIAFEDAGPEINSMVDAVIVSEPLQVVNGTYDADFGADGLDFLTLALGDAAAGFAYAETGDPAVQARVDVTGTANFTFYYTTSTDAGGNALIEAYFDAAESEPFFTLAVNTGGTYVFTLLNDGVLSGTAIDFGAIESGNFQSLELDGVTVDSLDPAGNDQNVNVSGNGLATGVNQNVTEGETVTFRFDAPQHEVGLSLSKWTGNGSFATVELVFLDAGGNQIGTRTVEIAKPSGNGSVLVDVEQGTADADPSDATVFVDFAFQGLDLHYVDTVADTEGNLGFNLGGITFDLQTSIGDFTAQFDLAATDNDGDSTSLDNGLVIALEGGDPATLTGTGAPEILMGASGDDVLVFDAADSVIDGGTGTDTLRAAGGDVDLTAFSGTLAGVEVIDLATDAGANALTIAAADVLQSDTGTVTVLGGAVDTVNLDGAWVMGASVGGFTAYTLAGATVEVEDTITGVNII